jgi:hypothetical protein
VPYLIESANITNRGALPVGPLDRRHRVDGERPSYIEKPSPERQTWAGIAAAYATYTSPLRPCRDDLEIVERAAHDWSRAHPDRLMRALLLGVTPDIAAFQWPPGSTLIGLDSSMPVIKAIWPGDVCAGRWATCSNWLSMPLRQRSCDFVTGDGSLNAFRYPDGWRAAAAAIRHVLTERGMLVIRCYVRPDEPEGPDDVIADLLGPGIADINHFKFRLFLAMQRSTDAGSAVREIYRFLRSRVSHDVLRSMPGWSEAAVNGFELWRNADTVYTFPTLSEVREVLGRDFCERAVRFPSYALGSSCPTLLLGQA